MTFAIQWAVDAQQWLFVDSCLQERHSSPTIYNTGIYICCQQIHDLFVYQLLWSSLVKVHSGHGWANLYFTTFRILRKLLLGLMNIWHNHHIRLLGHCKVSAVSLLALQTDFE